MMRAILVAGGAALSFAVVAVLTGSPSPMTSSGVVPAQGSAPGHCTFSNNIFHCVGRAEMVVTAADGQRLLIRGPFTAQFGLEPAR